MEAAEADGRLSRAPLSDSLSRRRRRPRTRRRHWRPLPPLDHLPRGPGLAACCQMRLTLICMLAMVGALQQLQHASGAWDHCLRQVRQVRQERQRL